MVHGRIVAAMIDQLCCGRESILRPVDGAIGMQEQKLDLMLLHIFSGRYISRACHTQLRLNDSDFSV